jgi:hypothetical protein
MSLSIRNQTRNTVKWKDAKPMTLYRTAPDDLLVLHTAKGKAVAMRVNGCASTQLGDVWCPGSESTWIEVNAELIIEGDVL